MKLIFDPYDTYQDIIIKEVSAMVPEDLINAMAQSVDMANALSNVKSSLADLNEMIAATDKKIAKTTVLLIDDDPSQIKTARVILKDNYTILSSLRGREAVELFKQHQRNIKAVLLDIRLPDINGFEVFNQLKEIKPQIPIIFITAYQDSYESQEVIAEKYRPFGYIVKNHEKEIEMIKSTLASAVDYYTKCQQLDNINPENL